MITTPMGIKERLFSQINISCSSNCKRLSFPVLVQPASESHPVAASLGTSGTQLQFGDTSRIDCVDHSTFVVFS
jgi:hypothetical protein